jgi:hypothetical protein
VIAWFRVVGDAALAFGVADVIVTLGDGVACVVVSVEHPKSDPLPMLRMKLNPRRYLIVLI